MPPAVPAATVAVAIMVIAVAATPTLVAVVVTVVAAEASVAVVMPVIRFAVAIIVADDLGRVVELTATDHRVRLIVRHRHRDRARA